MRSILRNECDSIHIMLNTYLNINNLLITYFIIHMIHIENKRGWLITLSIALLSISNASNWIAYAPVIYKSVLPYFGFDTSYTSLLKINMLAQVYMIIFVVTFPFSSLLLDRYGLQLGVRISAILNLCGSALRLVGNPNDNNLQYLAYGFNLVGQILCGFSQTLFLQIPSKFSSIWFPIKTRGLITAIISTANQVGIAIGYLISSTLGVYNNNPNNFYYVLVVQAGLAFIAVILIFLTVEDAPKTAVSTSSTELIRTTQPIKTILISIIKNKSYILTITSFGIIIGSLYAIETLIDQYAKLYGYNTIDAGIIGIVIVCSGIVGSLLVGVLIKKIRNFKLFIISMSIATTLSYTILTIMFYQHVSIENIIMIPFGLIGFFSIGIMPIYFELILEYTHPLPGALITGICLAFATIFGIILINILLQFSSVIFLTVFTAISTVLIFFVSHDYKREQIDNTETVIEINNPTNAIDAII